MNQGKTALIREAIAQARAEESVSRELETYMSAAAKSLHGAIALPEENPGQALTAFVIGYIEQVPDFLQTLEELMYACGLHEHGRVFITIAEDFFLQPPELIKHWGGLRGLIDEAYLAHRLMEEVNDRLMMLCGLPLTPADMTLANILVHDLLGEEYANQLDLAVHYAVESLFAPGQTLQNRNLQQFLSRYKDADWESRLRGWPGLDEESGIRLRLSTSLPGKTTAH
jgi:hypothetical protein